MANKLIVYKSNLNDAIESYFNSYDISLTNNNSAYFIVSPSNTETLVPIVNDKFKKVSRRPIFSSEGSNDALAHIYSSTAPVLGGDTYSSFHKPAIFLLYQPHVLEMYFLKHYLNEVDATIHLFMSEAAHNSGNLVESLKDYLPFMNFDKIDI